VRLLAGLALLSLVCCASADRLIHIPLGKKVPRKEIRFEGGFPFESSSKAFGYLDIGIDAYLDATIRTFDVSGEPRKATLDFGYNYIAPIPDASPGISVGVQDAAGRTADGRRFYLASTYRTTLSGSASMFTSAEATLGVYAGRRSSAFVGVMLPITPAFRLLAEHDGYRVNAGLEGRPVSNISIKLLFIDTKPALSAQVRMKY
jgi:hypothetical protein